MKTPIEISVLISTYMNDNPKHFDRALKSIWSDQIVKPSEIILVIDGEIPPSLNQVIIKWKQKIGPKFKTLFQENNIGLAASLNNGLKLCNGQYIARMDADDICLKNRFSDQLKYLQENPDVDVVGSWSEIIDKNSFIIGTKVVDEVVSFDSLTFSCEVIHPTVMFRGDFFGKYGFYDGFYEKSQDWELWLRACQKGAVIKNIQQSLLKLRIDSNLVSRRKNEQFYNRKIISKYSKGLVKYKGLARSWIIELLPLAVLKFIVNRKYKK